MKNEIRETLHDIDLHTPTAPYVEYQEFLQCTKCKRKAIPEDAYCCPGCGGYDLIPWTVPQNNQRKHVR